MDARPSARPLRRNNESFREDATREMAGTTHREPFVPRIPGTWKGLETGAASMDFITNTTGSQGAEMAPWTLLLLSTLYRFT